MSKKDIEIVCIYRSSVGKEVCFYDLKNRTEVLDEKDYSVDNFWNIEGGFSITLKSYCNVFNDTNFYVLLKPISFLLHSLYWLNDKKSDWFDEDDFFLDSVVIRTMSNESLVLRRKDKENLSLFFYPPEDNQKGVRGKHYFSSIPINQQDWREAVTVALEEYFYIAEQVLSQNPNGQNASVLREYIGLWKNITLPTPRVP